MRNRVFNSHPLKCTKCTGTVTTKPGFQFTQPTGGGEQSSKSNAFAVRTTGIRSGTEASKFGVPNHRITRETPSEQPEGEHTTYSSNTWKGPSHVLSSGRGRAHRRPEGMRWPLMGRFGERSRNGTTLPPPYGRASCM